MSNERKIKTVIQLYERMTYQIENNEHSEEKLLHDKLSSNRSLIDVPLSLTDCHVIACIGDNEDVNGTFISKRLNITKGGVSKATAKLIDKGMVEVVRYPSNRKEVYYKLTELGCQVYDAHAQMHEKAKKEQRMILSQYTAAELDSVKKFLIDFTSDLTLKE